MSGRGGSLLREARLRRGLSQRDLARLAGVPQPAISAIETGRRSPTLDLLQRIVDRGRLPLDLVLVDEPPASAAAAAREVRRRLGEPSTEPSAREDAALRAVIDLRDALQRASPGERHRLVADRPVLTGDRRWDAFVAGVVEEICTAAAEPPPAWTQEPARFVRPFWYLSTLTAFHDWEVETAPAALVRHGVLAAEGELASA
ncbi:MAG: helix-turn-helix transcriptional regulator [Acidimicrobiales bacterium]